MMSTLSGYLTRIFLGRFFLLLLGLVAFVLSLDLVVNAGEVLDAGQGDPLAVGRYAMLRLPEIVSQLISICTLLAGLVTLAQLVRNSELVSIWNAGVSPFRTLVCFMPVALLAGFIQLAIDDQLVPRSVAALDDWGVGDYGKRPNPNIAKGAFWLRIGQDIVRLPQERLDQQPFRNVTIFRRNDAGQLTARLDVAEASLEDGLWSLKGVTTRSFADNQITQSARQEWPTDLGLSNLQDSVLQPRLLTLRQLWPFVSRQGTGFWPPYAYSTWFDKRLSTPLAPLLLIFLIIPLAQRFQRTGGLAPLFAVGISVGFGFFILDRASLALGEAGLLNPLVAAWAPSLLLAGLSLALALRHERLARARKAPST